LQNVHASWTCHVGLGPPEHQYFELPLPAPTWKLGHAGFGAPSLVRTATHSPGSPFLIIHLVWNYFTTADQLNLTKAHPVIHTYAKQRVRALQLFPALRMSLSSPRPPIDQIVPLSHQLADHLACALLLFNFCYGDLLQWMGHTYMCSHHDFAKL
jgi:hypothetical protein